jgi:hypothetical protein
VPARCIARTAHGLHLRGRRPAPDARHGAGHGVRVARAQRSLLQAARILCHSRDAALPRRAGAARAWRTRCPSTPRPASATPR